MLIGGLLREESLVSSIAFMQDSVQFPSVACLWPQNFNPYNYFWGLRPLPYTKSGCSEPCRNDQKLWEDLGGTQMHSERYIIAVWLQLRGTRLKNVLTFNPSCFVYCSECFLSLIFVSDWTPEWTWLLEECMQLSPGWRMGRTVWSTRQSQTHHITTTANTGVLFPPVSTNLVQ